MIREIIIYSSIVMGSLCLLILLLNRSMLPKEFLWLRFYFLNWVTIEVCATVLSNNGLPNLPLLHLYTLLEFIFLGLFYREIIFRTDLRKKVNFNFFLGLGSLLIICNSFFFQDIYGHNSYAKSFSNLTFILLALFFIYRLIAEESKPKYIKSLAWINSGFLIYYMGIFLVFLLTDYLLRNNSEILYEIWKINIGLNNFVIIMVFIAIIRLMLIKRETSYHTEKF